MTLVLLEVRDAREYPPPWFNWVLIDTSSNEVVGYYKRYVGAESEMLEILQEREAEDENPAYGPGNPDWEHDFEKTRDA